MERIPQLLILFLSFGVIAFLVLYFLYRWRMRCIVPRREEWLEVFPDGHWVEAVQLKRGMARRKRVSFFWLRTLESDLEYLEFKEYVKRQNFFDTFGREIQSREKWRLTAQGIALLEEMRRDQRHTI